MPELTLDLAKTYTKSSDRCPTCKSQNMVWDDIDPEAQTREVHCSNCGLDFFEIYEMTGIGVRKPEFKEFIPGNYYIRARHKQSNEIQEFGPCTKARLPFFEFDVKKSHFIISIEEK